MGVASSTVRGVSFPIYLEPVSGFLSFGFIRAGVGAIMWSMLGVSESTGNPLDSITTAEVRTNSLVQEVSPLHILLHPRKRRARSSKGKREDTWREKKQPRFLRQTPCHRPTRSDSSPRTAAPCLRVSVSERRRLNLSGTAPRGMPLPRRGA